MIVIIGESGSGKTTLANDFVERNPQFHRVVTYTSRPKREGEIDGVDYHFCSDDEFDELCESGFFVEHAEYRGWKYGTAREDCESENAVVILTPSGLRALKKLTDDIISVYVWVDRETRLIKLIERGDNVDEAYRRNLSDVGMFDGVENEVDYVLANIGFRHDREETLDVFEQFLRFETWK